MSVREISAEEIILLVGNFVADSVINVTNVSSFDMLRVMQYANSIRKDD